MTTAAQRRLELAGVRRVRRAPGRGRPALRLVGGSGRLHWWHGRLTLGLTLLGAMGGAVFGIAQAVAAGTYSPVPALESYGAGAGLGAALGLLTGLLLGLLLGLADRYVLPQVVPRRPLWVRYREVRPPR